MNTLDRINIRDSWLLLFLSTFVGTTAFVPSSFSNEPPLKDLFVPPKGSVADSVFCPGCVSNSYLFQVHVKGTPKSSATQSKDQLKKIDIDLYSIVPFSVVPLQSSDCLIEEGTRTVSNDNTLKKCLGRSSPGWHDCVPGSAPNSPCASESLLVGRGAYSKIPANEQKVWCIVVNKDPRTSAKSGTVKVSVDIEMFGRPQPIQCSTDLDLDIPSHKRNYTEEELAVNASSVCESGDKSAKSPDYAISSPIQVGVGPSTAVNICPGPGWRCSGLEGYSCD